MTEHDPQSDPRSGPQDDRTETAPRPDDPASADTHPAAALALRLGRQAADRAPDDATPLERCLEVMLQRLGWTGDARHVIEALPHFDRIEQLDVMRAVLSRLGYETRAYETRLGALTPDQLPCVFEHLAPRSRFGAGLRLGRGRDADVAAEDGAAPQTAAFVALGRLPDGRIDVFDPRDGRRRAVDAPRARIRICRALADEIERSESAGESGGWAWNALFRFRRATGHALALTLAANVLALATPLFAMAVYNNILLSEQTATLTAAVLIALGALLLENELRRGRTALMASTAARLNAAIVREAFARVLTLPLSMTERASVSVQISRIRQLENLLSAFTSHLANAALDLPFTLVFVIAIGLIAGPLVYMPLLLALAFAVLALVFFPIARKHTFEAGQANLTAQTMIRETIGGIDSIRSLKAETVWIDRLGATLRRAARAKRRAGAFEQTQHALAQFMTMIAGVLTLFLGGAAVMAGELSIGGLIAVMMLVWKVLAPIQLAFLSINQIISARDTIRQVDALMELQPERRPGDMPTVFRRFRGRIELSNVSFRYPKGPDLVLRGVSLKIDPGEIVGVAGPTGVGKSTCLKLLLGLYKPSGGALYLDGLHFGQIDPAELRHAIAFAPPTPEFFYGSVAQNIRMAAATATDADIEAALQAVGLQPGEGALAEGLDTRLTAERLSALGESALQQLSLARALAKRAPMLLLDDPGALLDPSARAAFEAALERLRGRATVVIASNRPAQLALCDRIAVLHQGRIVACAPPSEILKQPSAA